MKEIHGITITGASGFAAEILDVNPPNSSRESIDTSHQGTVGSKTFDPAALSDNGELRFTMAFDPAEAPPIDADAESWAILFPGTTPKTWTFDGFLTNYDPSSPMGDKATADVTIKASGAIVIT